MIEQVTESRTGSGAVTESWSTFATVWADMQPLSARESYQMDQDIAERTVRFVIRYLSGLQHKMQISYDSRVFDIRTIIDIKGRTRSMEIVAVEVVS